MFTTPAFFVHHCTAHVCRGDRMSWFFSRLLPISPQLSLSSASSHSTPAASQSPPVSCVATATQPHLQKVSPTVFRNIFFLPSLEISKPAGGSILNRNPLICLLNAIKLSFQSLQISCQRSSVPQSWGWEQEAHLCQSLARELQWSLTTSFDLYIAIVWGRSN